MTKQTLSNKFHRREAHVAIVGLGYVGLPLCVAFAKAGYKVTGIDIDKSKVDSINRGESYIEDVSSKSLYPIAATTDYGVLNSCDAVSVCVPTPLNKTGDPNISYIVDATEQIAKHLRSGMVVVLESTTYPGTTTEVMLARLSDRNPNLKVGENFFLAFSPERIDPGRSDWTVETMPKVIGGVTPACLELASAYYGQAMSTLVPVSSPEAAEMVKLFENTFRSVNIGLANELLLMCEKLGLNAWEVLDAADTKPFGFMKFTPGPGLGGHCIPVDPHYLSWKLKTVKYNARFIELASEINTSMPAYWVQQVQDALNDVGKPVKKSRILLLGVAYKKDVGDLRESPALDIIHLLKAKGADVEYHDPHVSSFSYDELTMASVHDLDIALEMADCVVVTTDHSVYDWAYIAKRADLLVDTRHVVDSARIGSTPSDFITQTAAPHPETVLEKT
ncbi:nucleotide sugar dehydrogenase [Chloroflexi bacterium TSY]|nr:nucleotide sugar dehydrogenase [Chloroflexi bacterium TSY]